MDQPSFEDKSPKKPNINVPNFAHFDFNPRRPGEIALGLTEVWRTQDRGESWTEISPVLAPRPAVGIAYEADGDTIWVAFPGGSLFRRSRGPGGDWRWVERLQPVSVGGLLRCMAIDTRFGAESARIFLGTSGGRVFATRDAGATWDEITGDLPHIGINCLGAYGSGPGDQRVVVGNLYGVFFTGGPAGDATRWTELGRESFPRGQQVTDMQLDLSRRRILVGVWGRGAYLCELP